jgi:acetolactate synthase-1/2/3 large subunit
MERNPQAITKAEFIAQYLVTKKTPAVFTLSGGMIAFIIDAIDTLGITPIIGMRHEQAAGFAAETCTRVSGVPTVALATSGPGATNLITAIASSFFDSVPTIYITGQVSQLEIKKSKDQRQNGFQELNIVESIKNLTKFSIMVDSNSDLEKIFNQAWEIATSGRPGPVLIDIPIDVQQEIFESRKLITNQPKNIFDNKETINSLLSKIPSYKYPLILAGGGIVTSGAVQQFRQMVEKLKLPVVHSLMAVDALSSDSKFRVGMIGSYGNKAANFALSKCDFLICLGSRLDIRQIGSDIESFTSNKEIFRVDIDEFELNGRVKVKSNLKLNLKDYISDLDNFSTSFDFNDWNDEIHLYNSSNSQRDEQDSDLVWNPNDALSQIGDICEDTEGFIVDVGQHQMWAAQSLSLKPHHRFITSGGLGAMGFSIPSAIGACFAKKGTWSVIVGDGCAQLSIAELQTIKENNLPILIFLVNNNQHGMVAQFQETNVDSRFTLTRKGYSTPNFIELAKSFRIPSFMAQTTKELQNITKNLDLLNTGPILIEIKLSQNAKALPKNKW